MHVSVCHSKALFTLNTHTIDCDCEKNGEHFASNLSKWQIERLLVRMARRIWKETKQEPGTAGPGTTGPGTAWPGNMLGFCLVSFHFMLAILGTSTVERLLVVPNF